MALDWVLGWLKLTGKGEPVPPYCVEVVMKDDARYYLHSVVAYEDETRTMCMRVWDLRAMNEKEQKQLKARLNKIRNRRDLSPAEKVHPKLDWANVHVHYDDVTYCVEWHDRLWPEDERPKIGFEQQ